MESIPTMSTHLYLYMYIFKEKCNQRNALKTVWRLKKSSTEMLGNTRLNYWLSLHLYCSFYIRQSHQSFFRPLMRGIESTLPFMSSERVFCLLLTLSFLQTCWSWWVFHGAHQPASKHFRSDGSIFTTHLWGEKKLLPVLQIWGWKKAEEMRSWICSSGWDKPCIFKEFGIMQY